MPYRRCPTDRLPARNVPWALAATRAIVQPFALLVGFAASAARATPISDKYAALGGPAGFLGDPVVLETAAPDGVGAFRHYEGGSIHWHPRTGAHEVRDPIRQRWSELNWEKGYLGYPITDEIDTADGGGRVSRFEGGELIWNAATNFVREVRSSDLVVELPFPAGETWQVIQAHALHGKSGSYSANFGAPALFLPQALPWSLRPSASTGTVLATMGDSGASPGACHLHFCVATAPSRPQYEPRETVPVSFRNYQSRGTGVFGIWTNVAQGYRARVNCSGVRGRRAAPSSTPARSRTGSAPSRPRSSWPVQAGRRATATSR